MHEKVRDDTVMRFLAIGCDEHLFRGYIFIVKDVSQINWQGRRKVIHINKKAI